MFKKSLLVIIVIAIAFAFVATRSLGAQAQQQREPNLVPVSGALANAMLVFVLNGPEKMIQDPDNPAQQIMTVEQKTSLGTVFAFEGQMVVLTHGHWTLNHPDWQRIDIFSGAGSYLTTISMAELHSLIQFQDGGSMIMRLPGQLQGKVAAAPILTDTNLSAGTTVMVARHVPGQNRIVFMQANLNQLVTYGGLPTLAYTNEAGGYIIPGDSGGGVFLNGQLVGNNWLAMFKEVTESRSILGLTIGTQQYEIHASNQAALLTTATLDMIPMQTTQPATPDIVSAGPG